MEKSIHSFKSDAQTLCSSVRRSLPSPRLSSLTSYLLPVTCYLLLLTCYLLPVTCFSGDLLGGRLYTVPEKVYVNQAFDIHFELEVTFGSEVQDVRVSGFPNNPDLLTVGPLEGAADSRVTRDGQSVTVRRFTAKARGHRPIDRTFSPTMQCMLVERRNAGFFSHWQSFPKQKRLEPFTLRVLPLPETGRPAHFGGAIGDFRLDGQLSKTAVQPGDIVTLTLELTGRGWLPENIAMPPPGGADGPSAISPLFKTYPAKELLREPARLKTEQVFIPQSTNAAEIAAARFCFFNPATEAYEESVAGPFRLTFSAAPAAPKADEVRVIDTARPAAAQALPQAVTIERVNLTLRHAAPLLAGSAGALAAFFVFFLLVGTHRRLAAAAGLLVLAGGVCAAWLLGGRTDTATRRLARRTDVRFAPSQAAAALFPLNPGASVVPLEKSGAWVRIDASGRRGWVPADALAE
jgi:hypothetical protein